MTTGPLRRDDDEAVHDAGGAVVKTVGERLLAAIPITTNAPLPLLRRVANASFRLGRVQDARLLAEIAGRADLSEAIRLLAVTMLGAWERPSGRDKVMGLLRPNPSRPASSAIEALRPKLEALLA